MESSDLMLPIILGFSLGLYAMWQGWLRLRAPNSDLVFLALPEMGALAYVRFTRGEAQANQLRSQLRRADRLRRSAYSYLIVGTGLVLVGCLLLFARIL